MGSTMRKERRIFASSDHSRCFIMSSSLSTRVQLQRSSRVSRRHHPMSGQSSPTTASSHASPDTSFRPWLRAIAHIACVSTVINCGRFAEALLTVPAGRTTSRFGQSVQHAPRGVNLAMFRRTRSTRRRQVTVCRVKGDGWKEAPAMDPFDERKMGALGTHVINWYPGHIAKAEKQLQDYLQMVDVVIEVRDCRIPGATTHQLVPKWVGKRPLIVALNRVDSAPAIAVEQWKDYLVKGGGLRADSRGGNVPVFIVNSKKGTGVHEVKKAALKAGSRVNERRVRRGMNPRSVRVAVIGFPNVGKSALINRLMGRRVAKSMNVPGVTKKLNWVRMGGHGNNRGQELELLDSPGIIPARQEDQRQALKLAICNDIGQASYDNQVVAAKLMDQLVEASVQFPGYVDLAVVSKRYGIDPRRHTGEEYLHLVAKKMYFGEKNSAADKILGDFRKGYLGRLCLEAPRTPNAAYNRLPLKTYAVEGGASGAGVCSPGTSMPTGEEEEYAAAAKAAREFIGTGDFEGW